MWRRNARRQGSTDTDTTRSTSKGKRASSASVTEARVARHLDKRAQAERADQWDTVNRRRGPRRWPMVVAAIATICVVAGATVLVMAPASWVAAGFSEATQGRVALANAQGSLWDGSANLMLSTGAGASDNNGTGPASEQAATLLPNRINWHTRFWPLFSGHIQMVMQEARPLAQPVLIDAGWQQTMLYAGSLGVPASLLVGLGAPFNTLDLQGDVTLDWTDWRILGRGRSALAYGQLTVDLHNMSSSVSRVSPLGSYRSTFSAQGIDATVSLTTVSGPLILSGNGRLQGPQFSFDGRASSTPDARDNLAGLLNLLGPRIDSDTVALSFVR
jgi:general secretion pathway protein N